MVSTALSSILQRVDPRIGLDDAAGAVHVALRQSFDDLDDLTFSEPTHLGDHSRELLEVVVEGFCCMFGKSRCMFGNNH